MEIVNIEKLDGHKIIVMTGRNEDVREVAKSLQAKLYYCPRYDDYFMDYPVIVKELQEITAWEKEVIGRSIVIITTQSEEFLDCLLESEFNFILATVRRSNTGNSDIYRLRVLTKEEAWANRRDFNMELRR